MLDIVCPSLDTAGASNTPEGILDTVSPGRGSSSATDRAELCKSHRWQCEENQTEMYMPTPQASPSAVAGADAASESKSCSCSIMILSAV